MSHRKALTTPITPRDNSHNSQFPIAKLHDAGLHDGRWQPGDRISPAQAMSRYAERLLALAKLGSEHGATHIYWA